MLLCGSCVRYIKRRPPSATRQVVLCGPRHIWKLYLWHKSYTVIMAVIYNTYCDFFLVQPSNQLTIKFVALCDKTFRRPWYKALYLICSLTVSLNNIKLCSEDFLSKYRYTTYGEFMGEWIFKWPASLYCFSKALQNYIKGWINFLLPVVFLTQVFIPYLKICTSNMCMVK